MSDAPPQVCEVKTGDGWITVTLAEARSNHDKAPKRCPACHGAVNVMGSYAGWQKWTMAHRRSHTGCPLQPAGYSGTPSPHPMAVS